METDLDRVHEDPPAGVSSLPAARQVYHLDEGALNAQQRLVELEKDLREMKKSAEKGRNRRWFQDFALVLSVITFCFSFLTTLYNYRLTDEQNVHNARVELRGILQRLTEINREYISVNENMSMATMDQGSASTTRVGSSLGTMSALQMENALLAEQAHDLITNVLHGDVNTGEYLTVGYTYQGLGLNHEALALYREAEQRINNLSDALSTYRSLANLSYMMGNIPEGRRYFELANSVATRYPVENPYYLQQIYWFTESQWFVAELGRAQCDQAKLHYNRALEIGRGLGAPGFPNPYETQIQASQSYLDGCKQQPLPQVSAATSPGTPMAFTDNARAIVLMLLHRLSGGW